MFMNYLWIDVKAEKQVGYICIKYTALLSYKLEKKKWFSVCLYFKVQFLRAQISFVRRAGV